MCPALRFCLFVGVLVIPVLSLPTEDFETVKTSNAAILNRLGLVPLTLSDGHHRKRLAPDGAWEASTRLHQSSPYGRRHNDGGSPHDSHVYIVKLPASPPYYSFSKPHKGKDQNVTIANPNPGFKNNGKPGKIYHWNLPLMKKINEKKKQLTMAKIEQARKKMEAEKERQKVAEKMEYLKKLAQEQLVAESQRTKPTRNNDKWLSDPEKIEARNKASDSATQLKIFSKFNHDKVYRLEEKNDEAPSVDGPEHHHFNNWHQSTGNDVHGSSRNALDNTRNRKHKKKSAGISYYYAPALTGKSASTSISKHFAGNGKPKAFYVMEKSRKPVYYHPLLP